jgi:hypothetical protein
VQSRAATLGHEGVHADDAANVFASSKSMAAFFRAWESYRYQTEYDAILLMQASIKSSAKRTQNMVGAITLLQPLQGKHKTFLISWTCGIHLGKCLTKK